MVRDVISGDSLTNVAIKNGFTNTQKLKRCYDIYIKHGINGLRLSERNFNPFMKPKRNENFFSIMKTKCFMVRKIHLIL